MKTREGLLALFFAPLLALTGCVQVASIPSVAHSGDTVVLGLGGIKRNWDGEKPKNVQVTITDSASNIYNLVPDQFFQGYPDYRSWVSATPLDGSPTLSLKPYDGGWFMSVPLTDSNGQPLALASGVASISITADNFTQALSTIGQPHSEEGDLASIPIEIVAGPPSATSSATQFIGYDGRDTHFLVRPDGATTATVGGACYVVDYLQDRTFGPLAPVPFPVAHNPFIKFDYQVKDNGNGTGSYTIYIYNREGFAASPSNLVKQATLADLGVHFEYFNSDADLLEVKTDFVLDTANSYYLDVDGNRITGLAPEMLHATDL